MELPIYNAIISDEDDGVFAVSLVDCPATEVNWIAFDKDEKKEVQFSVDKVKHCLTAPLMLCDTPIYRRSGDYEYYIQYSAETLEQMAEKMLRDNTFNEIDFQHNGEIIEKGKVNLVELYIKNDTNPSPFPEVKNGSIICTYKINDEEIWESATNGTFNGFSLAGMFNITPHQFKKEENNDNSIKEQFMDILSKLKELIVEAEEQTIKNEEEVVEEPTEEVTEPTEEVEEEGNKELDDLKAQVEQLVADVAAMAEKIVAIEEKLKEPVETPIEETEDEEEVIEDEDKFSALAKIIR